LKMAVIGDEVTEYRESYYPKPEERAEAEAKEGGMLWTFVKIPDEWRRKRQETTLGRVIINYGISVAFIGGLGVAGLVLFLRNLKSEVARTIPWKRLAKWASWSLVGFATVFVFGDRLAIALNQYDTAVPLKMVYGVLGIVTLLGGPFTVGIALLVFGMAWYFAARAFGSERLPGWAGMPGMYYRDAVVIGIAGAVGLLGLETVFQVVSQHWPTVHRTAEAAFGADFGARIPGAAILGATLQQSLLLTG